jgi:hypothetical protein
VWQYCHTAPQETPNALERSREIASDSWATRGSGANHPRRRGDATFLPDFQGVITTDDRQIVAATTHVSADQRYRWLNDSLSVGTGEVRAMPDGSTVWEPPPD